MTIEQNIWGATPDGEVVIIYTMRNSRGSEVRLCNAGAAVVSVRFADRNGVVGETVLSHPDAAGYLNDRSQLLGKSLGRVADRVSVFGATAGGAAYAAAFGVADCPVKEAGDLASRIWESRVETNRVVFSTVSEEGNQGYGHQVAVEVVFDFDDDDSLEVTCLAGSDGPTPVNLSDNIFWNLSGGGDVSGHTLRLAASRAVSTSVCSTPCGSMCDAAGSGLDFTSPRRIGEYALSGVCVSGCNPYFPADGWRCNILGEVGELYDDVSGRRVTVLSSQPGCVLRLAGSPAGGVSGVSIGCQSYPWPLEGAECGVRTLEEGVLYCQKTVYRLGIV